VRIWEQAGGDAVLTLTGQSNWVQAVVFSPDGRRLASASDARIGLPDRGTRPAEVKVWEIPGGRVTFTLHPPINRVISLAFSPDGTTLALASGDATVTVWDLATGQTTHTLRADPHDSYDAVAFHPDGKQLLAGGATVDDVYDGTLTVWDLTTGKAIRRLKDSGGPIQRGAFSPDGQRLVAAGSALKVWDASTYQELLTLSAWNWVGFSPDGWLLASTGFGGPVKLLDATPLTETAGHEREAAAGDVANGPRLPLATGVDGHYHALIRGSLAPGTRR
jgi:WD40 repeat protein